MKLLEVRCRHCCVWLFCLDAVAHESLKRHAKCLIPSVRQITRKERQQHTQKGDKRSLFAPSSSPPKHHPV